ncbi:MAG TPA: hypothetical protein VFO79_15030 [Xanthomonadales bacterium]|nr:hypothetical protein [Xanthomonadales bacterium]
MRTLLLVLLVCACDEGTKTKAKETVNKVDKVMDKVDTDDAKEHLAKAKSSLAAGTDPAEDCSWVASQTDTDATKPTLDELRKLCSLDAPLARAQAAVVRAEKAKAEQPEAPSLTECQSDDWAAMKTKLDGAHGSDPKWAELEARWAKVCPDQK